MSTLFDEPATPAADGRVRCKLVVAYDGTDFRGYAVQRDVRTVEGVLVAAIEPQAGGPLENVACAGRTDAGVHAWGQVVTFDAAPDIDLAGVQHAVNRRLGPEIVVRSAERADAGLDARRSAKWRAYTYAIVNRPVPDPFLARYAWWVPQSLDLPALRLGADPFVGEHDFAAFCRKGPEGSSTTRRVLSSRWVTGAEDGLLRYEIVATSFCWQMVRSIVGTLVEVGTGKRRPGELTRVLRARDRAAAGAPAPPQGLCLWDVGY